MPPKAKPKAKSEPKGKSKDAKGKNKGKDKGKGKGKGKKVEEEPPVCAVEEVKPPKTPPIPLTVLNQPYLDEKAKSVTVKLLMKETPELYNKKYEPHLGTPIHRIFQEIEHPHLIQYMRDIGMDASTALNLKKIDNRTPILGSTGIEDLDIDRFVIPSTIGVAPHAIKNHVFVMYVEPGTPAHLAGLRFGDEILDVNDGFVYKWTPEQISEFIKNQPDQRFPMIIRRRPFTREFTFNSGKCEALGFQIHEGRILNVYYDTEAYRKGLLVNYQIIEINHKNVIGMDDKQMRYAFQRNKQFSITIMPGLIYEHMMLKMGQENVFDYYFKFNKVI